MLTFSEKLTLYPATMSAADLDRLREMDFGDEAILEIVHIVGYFNYINRVADGLGIDLEPEWKTESQK